MAIKTVQAIINGQAYTLTLNSGTGKYEATITAPGKTSFNQPGGYYNVQVKATNEAGSVGTADASTMAGLKLVVRERVAPVITIISPSTGAYVSNSKQPVVFTVVDETDGSGVDLSTLVVKQDGTAVASSAITSTAIANGYQATYTPTTALTDGSHTVTVDCKDHDGNAAAQKATTYKVDTVPPTLNITAPVAGLITASASQTVAGTTNDATSSPVAPPGQWPRSTRSGQALASVVPPYSAGTRSGRPHSLMRMSATCCFSFGGTSANSHGFPVFGFFASIQILLAYNIAIIS